MPGIKIDKPLVVYIFSTIGKDTPNNVPYTLQDLSVFMPKTCF